MSRDLFVCFFIFIFIFFYSAIAPCFRTKS